VARLFEKQREQNKYGLLAKFDQIYYSWGAIGPMGGYLFGKTTRAASTRRISA
jgi:arabinogalactan oligomer/maltooligosaccharide transport system substrate-binding protein